MKLMRYALILLVLTIVCVEVALGTSVRKPTMPRGLTLKKSVPLAGPNLRDEKSRNLQRSRRGLQGYKRHYTFSDMNFEELNAAKEKELASKNYSVACKYLDRMITLCDDINKKAELIVELADLLFDQQSFDDAVKWYTEFSHLYPGNNKVEYASYRAIVCFSKKILSADRDQTPTEKALEMSEAFLKRDDVFTVHRAEVKKIRRECMQQLAASDFRVAEFFINSKEFSQAQKRLETIRTTWLSALPEVATDLAKLELNLEMKFSDFKAPESSIKLAQVARPTSKKVDMITRF